MQTLIKSWLGGTRLG